MWKLFGTGQIAVNALTSMLFLREGFGLVGLAWAAVISHVTLAACCVWFINRRLTGVRIEARLVNIATLLEILPYSARAFGLSSGPGSCRRKAHRRAERGRPGRDVEQAGRAPTTS